ncbi:MAG: hypothetical protein M9932_04300 [Xanthobacteraceae bacterium]|nr:hypothetical protein [Xanthobacteraceae bacterium]
MSDNLKEAVTGSNLRDVDIEIMKILADIIEQVSALRKATIDLREIRAETHVRLEQRERAIKKRFELLVRSLGPKDNGRS